jgi:hypothetical protein
MAADKAKIPFPLAAISTFSGLVVFMLRILRQLIPQHKSGTANHAEGIGLRFF